ncbi:MAG: DUF1592 domain-containing protein [Acidobacteria bacterium]|nr:DUF1592 domain-containing protein [Acidobacteriota bacterium]
MGAIMIRTMWETFRARLGLGSTRRRLGGACLLLALAATTVPGTAAAQAPEAASASPADALHAEAAPFFAEHCVVCHGNRLSTVNLNLERLAATLDPQAASRERDTAGAAVEPQIDTWTRVLGRLNAGQMPPPGRPRPADDAIARLSASIEAYLADAGYRRTADPGRVTARRLNRVEYDNTVRSLLGVHGSPADEFPIDDSGYGFDNIGDVLSVSPLLMEKYVAAAKRLSRVAIFGEPVPAEPTLLARYMGRRSHDAGNDLTGANILPYSMRGALYGSHLFPWDAEYELRFRAANYRYSRRQLIARGAIEAEEHDRRDRALEARMTAEERLARFIEDARQSQPPVPVVATLDGQVFREELIEGSNAFGYERGEFVTRVPVTAGVRDFRISYPHVADIDDPRDNVMDDGRRVLYVDYVDIVGPFNPSQAPPASYDRILVCRPRPGKHDEGCAREVVTNLARRAYRRPVTAADVDPLLGLVRQARAAGDSFEEGIRLALQAVLLSPNFLFRIERDPAAGEDVRALDDHELASRLSYFLWADMPDERLFRLADAGRLSDPAVLRAETLRMLADPKARTLVTDFAAQWLQLRALDRAKPDPARFPTVDDELRDAMRIETELFLQTIVREDRSVLDLLDAPFTFVNGPLARHYGIPGIDGEAFQRVALDGRQRSGLLSHASVLTVSSYPTRTSPVLRGKWVLENLLGAPPPEPPADVPALEADGAASGGATLREQMEAHRTNPSCAVCHNQIDPIGFGLEKYDAAGAWRTHEGDAPIDDTGVLPDGTTFRGPAELKQVLRDRADAFRRNLSEKLLTYALGRGLEHYDAEALAAIVDTARENGGRWSAFVTGVVESAPFRMRRAETRARRESAP